MTFSATYLLYFYVGAGGALGAMLRFWISRLAFPAWCDGKFCATFSANLIGCALLGVLYAYVLHAAATLSDMQRAFIQAGFLGGLTTFSTFILDIHMLTSGDAADWGKAAAYLLLSIIGGWGCFIVCYAGTRHIL